MRRWLVGAIGSLLLILACVPSSDAVLQLRNNANSRFSAEINIGTAHPTIEFTYVWVMQYRIDRPGMFQTPQATGFGPGNDIAKRYIVSFDGSGGISNNWAIGEQGSDTYGTDAPQIGRIYYQALRRRSLGGGNYEQIFYYDLPNLSKTVRQDASVNNAWDPGTYIKWGAVPWTDGEGMDGFIEGAWLFDTELTTTQIINQVTSPTLADASLSGNVFAHWPLISNGTDTSGNGRHLSLVGGAGDAFYDGTTNLTSGDTTPPAPPTNVRVSWLEWFFTWLFS